MKWMFAAGVAVGYVLGARAGRERYEQIAGAARRIRENPRVQDTAVKLREQAEQVVCECRDRVRDTDIVAKVFKLERGDESGALPDPKPEHWESAGVTTPARADRERNPEQSGL